MCGAERLRGLASAEIFARLQRRNADQAAQHRAVDLGALSGLPALHDSGEDGVGRIETGAEIADGHPAFDGRATLLAGDAHDAAHRLHGHVEGALSGIGSRLPIARYGAVDQAGILRTERFVTESEPVGRSEE